MLNQSNESIFKLPELSIFKNTHHKKMNSTKEEANAAKFRRKSRRRDSLAIGHQRIDSRRLLWGWENLLLSISFTKSLLHHLHSPTHPFLCSYKRKNCQQSNQPKNILNNWPKLCLKKFSNACSAWPSTILKKCLPIPIKREKWTRELPLSYSRIMSQIQIRVVIVIIIIRGEFQSKVRREYLRCLVIKENLH